MQPTSPKIAIYYSNLWGRNDGPPLYYFEAFKRLGYNVTHLLADKSAERYGPFDVHLWVDWGEDGLIPMGWKPWYPTHLPGKHVYVASDTHLDNGYRFETAKKFNYAFFNQKRAVEEYPAFLQSKDLYVGPNTIHTWDWLPHAAEPLAYPHTEQVKKYDVCFIGHLQDQVNHNGYTRVDALDRLFKEIPNFYFGTRVPGKPELNMFEDAAKKFCQSKIVFNVSIKDDVNMRVFETLSTGSFLLTNRIPTIEELFTNGQHLVLYDDLTDMVVKAKYYLSNDEERERIARAGMALVREKHTYEERCKTILRTVGCL